MIRELSTMALIAIATTNLSSHVGTVFGAANDISGIYEEAGKAEPYQAASFMTRIIEPKARLEAVAKHAKVVYAQQLEMGPFGVVVASQ